jgi:hypothetical protein
MGYTSQKVLTIEGRLMNMLRPHVFSKWCLSEKSPFSPIDSRHKDFFILGGYHQGMAPKSLRKTSPLS